MRVSIAASVIGASALVIGFGAGRAEARPLTARDFASWAGIARTIKTAGAELADLNRDGNLDLALVGEHRLEVRLNSSGRFPRRSYVRTLTDGRDLAVGDADGDGDQDIYVLQGTNATVPDLLLLNQGSGDRYVRFHGLPQVTAGEGDRVQAIPGWRNASRAAFLVSNGFTDTPGPRQLIALVGG